MTQEYTPTDQQVIDDYIPDEEDIGFDALTMSMAEWKRLKVAAFDRWLAAYDARIRVDALKITDKEHDIATQAIIDALTSSDRNDYGIASESAFSAVAEHRKEQKQ
ncbi:MAG: hypothetical protein LKI88_00735 [Bifidobacterium sp.]|jgi:hypothetical protein|nr:hypothetical protein [Bifidobacterium sp.]MCI1864456.1 hypothetical protein [Bifidobacterium sp.]